MHRLRLSSPLRTRPVASSGQLSPHRRRPPCARPHPSPLAPPPPRAQLSHASPPSPGPAAPLNARDGLYPLHLCLRMRQAAVARGQRGPHLSPVRSPLGPPCLLLRSDPPSLTRHVKQVQQRHRLRNERAQLLHLVRPFPPFASVPHGSPLTPSPQLLRSCPPARLRAHLALLDLPVGRVAEGPRPAPRGPARRVLRRAAAAGRRVRLRRWRVCAAGTDGLPCVLCLAPSMLPRRVLTRRGVETAQQPPPQGHPSQPQQAYH